MREEMLTQKPMKLLLKFAIPAIIGMVVMAIYNIVDRIFIGNHPALGSAGLAAAATGFPIMVIVAGIGLLFGNGGGTFFAINLGAGDRDKAEKIQLNALFLGLAGGIVIMLLGNLFIDDLLHMFGASDAILPLAREYFSIIFYGTPFSMVAYYGNNFSRAQGNPRNTMNAMLFGAVFNIVFDYVLIYIFHMGMRGAAWATVLGQVGTSVWQLCFLVSEKSLIPLKFHKFQFDSKICAKIISTGMPVLAVQFSVGAVSFLLNALSRNHGGDMGLSVIAVFSSLQTMIQMPIIGLTQGQLPIISYCYGAKRNDRIAGILKSSMLLSTGYVLIAFVVIQLFTTQVVMIFNREPDFVQAANGAIRIAFAAIPILGLQIVGANVFQATRQIRQSSFLNTLRQVLLFAPLAYMLSQFFGFTGIFAALPVADVLAFAITMFMLRRLLHRLQTENTHPENETLADEEDEDV